MSGEIWRMAISDKPFDQRSLIDWEAWFPPCFVRPNQQKNYIFFARRFKTTFKQKFSNLRPLLFISFPDALKISEGLKRKKEASPLLILPCPALPCPVLVLFCPVKHWTVWKIIEEHALRICEPFRGYSTFLHLLLSFLIVHPLILQNIFWSYKILISFSTIF